MQCDMDTLISTIANKKLDRNTEVTISVKGKVPDCKVIDTKNVNGFIDVNGNKKENQVVNYNKYLKPADMLHCDADVCFNTGTLSIPNNGYAVFYLPYDATQFANGIITFYGQYINGDVMISGDAKFTNADVYAVNNQDAPTSGEFQLLVIDLSQAPKSVKGEGWNATANGAYLAIKGSTSSTVSGLSTIAIFDSIEDFEINDTVKVQCLTELGADDEIDAAEETCFETGHDISSPTFERTITGSKQTANYQILNPLIGFSKGEAVLGFDIATKAFTVGTDGKVQIPDAYEKECGYILVSSDCDLLKRYDIQYPVTLDDEHYQVQTTESNGITIRFGENLVGQTVRISYPRKKYVTEQYASLDNVDTVKVRLYVPYTTTNGKKKAKIYNNVLVTSFSDTVNEDDSEFSVTFAIKRDENGHYYKIVEYTDGIYGTTEIGGGSEE